MFIYTATLSILVTILQKTHLAITTFSNYSAKNTFSNRCCHNICEIYSRQSLHSHSTTRGKRDVLEQRKGNKIFNTNTNTKSTSETCSGLALSLYGRKLMKLVCLSISILHGMWSKLHYKHAGFFVEGYVITCAGQFQMLLRQLVLKTFILILSPQRL